MALSPQRWAAAPDRLHLFLSQPGAHSRKGRGGGSKRGCSAVAEGASGEAFFLSPAAFPLRGRGALFPALFAEVICGERSLLPTLMAEANGAATGGSPEEGESGKKRKTAELKVVVVGDGGCGKTSLLLVYARGAFPEVSARGEVGGSAASRFSSRARAFLQPITARPPFPPLLPSGGVLLERAPIFPVRRDVSPHRTGEGKKITSGALRWAGSPPQPKGSGRVPKSQPIGNLLIFKAFNSVR